MKKRVIALVASGLLLVTMMAGCSKKCKADGCSEERLEGSDYCVIHAIADGLGGLFG
ncbi:MAG: hypothetical protein FWG31_04280 [Oscillospiraceae bacterium]|nr:hypothetical protein [Oscillospiraceae bacterium]